MATIEQTIENVGTMCTHGPTPDSFCKLRVNVNSSTSYDCAYCGREMHLARRRDLIRTVRYLLYGIEQERIND